MAASHPRRLLSGVSALLLIALLGPLTVPASAQQPSLATLSPPRADDAASTEQGQWLRRAMALLRQARHEAARAAFGEFLGRTPEMDGWRAVANAYLAEGQLPDAIAALQQTHRLEHDPELDHILRSLIFALEGSSTRAATALSEAVHRNPNARLWNLLGQQLERLGRDLQAIQAYAEAARLNPDDPRYWKRVGEAYERTGQYARAVDSYREAIALQASADAWSAIGRARLQERYYVQAVQAYREAVKLAPGDLDALAGLGIAYGAQKDWPAALETYYKVKALDPAAGEELFGIVFREKTK